MCVYMCLCGQNMTNYTMLKLFVNEFPCVCVLKIIIVFILFTKEAKMLNCPFNSIRFSVLNFVYNEGVIVDHALLIVMVLNDRLCRKLHYYYYRCYCCCCCSMPLFCWHRDNRWRHRCACCSFRGHCLCSYSLLSHCCLCRRHCCCPLNNYCCALIVDGTRRHHPNHRRAH